MYRVVHSRPCPATAAFTHSVCQASNALTTKAMTTAPSPPSSSRPSTLNLQLSTPNSQLPTPTPQHFKPPTPSLSPLSSPALPIHTKAHPSPSSVFSPWLRRSHPSSPFSPTMAFPSTLVSVHSNAVSSARSSDLLPLSRSPGCRALHAHQEHDGGSRRRSHLHGCPHSQRETLLPHLD